MTETKDDFVIKGAIAQFKKKANIDLPECPDCGFVGNVRLLEGIYLSPERCRIGPLKLEVTVCECTKVHRYSS